MPIIRDILFRSINELIVGKKKYEICKFLLVKNKFITEIHLKQSGNADNISTFTYSAGEPFLETRREFRTFGK